MLENKTVWTFRARHHGSSGNVGRDENGGHAHAETIKLERFTRSCFVRGRGVAVRFASRGHYVVVDSAVLVIDDQHGSRFPKLRIGADCGVGVSDKSFSF